MPSFVMPFVTVMLIVAEASRPSPTSAYERTTVALPIIAGVYERPLRAAFSAASVPVIVIEPELLAPDVNVIPLVDPKVSFPTVAVSVSGSTVLPALTSAMLIAFLFAVEKTSGLLTGTIAVVGAVIAGGLLRATLAEAERPSTESLSDMTSESDPLYADVG